MANLKCKSMTPEAAKNYQQHFEALKKWNENRASNEKKALERFYQLKDTFRNQQALTHLKQKQ